MINTMMIMMIAEGKLLEMRQHISFAASEPRAKQSETIRISIFLDFWISHNPNIYFFTIKIKIQNRHPETITTLIFLKIPIYFFSQSKIKIQNRQSETITISIFLDFWISYNPNKHFLTIKNINMEQASRNNSKIDFLDFLISHNPKSKYRIASQKQLQY